MPRRHTSSPRRISVPKPIASSDTDKFASMTLKEQLEYLKELKNTLDFLWETIFFGEFPRWTLKHFMLLFSCLLSVTCFVLKPYLAFCFNLYNQYPLPSRAREIENITTCGDIFFLFSNQPYNLTLQQIDHEMSLFLQNCSRHFNVFTCDDVAGLCNQKATDTYYLVGFINLLFFSILPSIILFFTLAKWLIHRTNGQRFNELNSDTKAKLTNLADKVGFKITTSDTLEKVYIDFHTILTKTTLHVIDKDKSSCTYLSKCGIFAYVKGKKVGDEVKDLIPTRETIAQRK